MVQRYIEIPQDGEITCMHEHFAGDYVKYEDYLILEAQLRQRTEERNAFAKAIADAGDEMVGEATYADAVALTERLGI